MTPLTLSLLTFVALVGLIGAAVAVVTRSRPVGEAECLACEAAGSFYIGTPEHTCHGIVDVRSPEEAEVWRRESRAREGR